MTKDDKKVILVIVEGPSDESAIGGILKEKFYSEETCFVVTHGDITSRIGVTPSNVITKLKDIIDETRKKYGYNWKDFAHIIHITDTDGAFTNGCVVKAETENIKYYEDHMEAANVELTEYRNKNKADVISKLCSTGKVHGVDYKIYFNSCNLEHVLFNALKDFSDDEKTEMSDDFAEEYDGHLQEFIKFISSQDVAVTGTYNETWKFIKKGKNSLQRHTNMHLIFEEQC